MEGLSKIDRYELLARRVLGGYKVGCEEALALLNSPDDDLLALLHGAFLLRKAYFGKGVRLHVLRNAKSGGCSEDCSFCSQSTAASDAGITEHGIQSAEEIVRGAEAACEKEAARYCIVTSGKSPNREVLDTICSAVERIRSAGLSMSICVSLGCLNREQAERLKAAGVNRVNHNLEAVENVFARLCRTHRHHERVATVRIIKKTGLELCSGGIIGVGETLSERVELALQLRGLDADAIPVNFLDPRPGTVFAGQTRISPGDALRTLAMFRFILPGKEIRIAAGREKTLGPMQPLGLFAADSMFTQGYLTTEGQGLQADLSMIAAAGFHVQNSLE